MINGTERILVCCGTRCAEGNAQEIACAIEDELAKRDFCAPSSVKVVRVGCAGECDQGPIVRLMPRDVTYYKVSTRHVAAIVDSLFGEPVKKLLFKKKRQHYEKLSDNPFFGLQHRVALRYVGVIDPLSIKDYIACGGYAALKKARTIPRLDILAKLQESGLRIKCEALASPETSWLQKERRSFQCVACNVSASSLDGPVSKTLAEGSPHALVEGMATAMYAIGATEGIFYMRPEDAQAKIALQRAIEDACANDAFGMGIDELKCEVGLSEHGGNDAFERTALSIDAETLAAIPAMLGEGLCLCRTADEPNPKETKAFALDGKAKHNGFVETPMGTSLRTLIFKIGGGVAGDRPLKAVEMGKPAGIYLPETLIDLPIDFDSFAEHSIPMDAGSISVLDDRSCIVKAMLDGFRQLSAQSQTTDSSVSELRKATAILERLCAGDAGPSDIEALDGIGLSMRNVATSHRVQRAANSLLSSMQYFRSEYEAHALEKRCPSGSCPKLTKFVISPEACAGCDVCSNACPTGAITGEQRQSHAIDYDKCISCGRCRDLCRFHAVLADRRLPISGMTDSPKVGNYDQ